MIRSGGDAELIREGRSTPLGFQDMEIEPTEIHFGSGDQLVLYTDGLIERRDEDLQDGLTRLIVAGRNAVDNGPGELTDTLVNGLSPGADREDDVAVLAVRAD
jgi:serine phosphatase RsbU (regulator of sigma subunit)